MYPSPSPFPTCNPNLVIDPATISTACATAAPGSLVANACGCHAQFLSLKKQYDDFWKSAGQQFQQQVDAYNNLLAKHTTWSKQSTFAQAVIPNNPLGIPIPDEYKTYPSYSSYSAWLADYPEPIVPPEPTHAPFTPQGNMNCCSQIFSNINVPNPADQVQFQNVVQQCNAQLPCLIHNATINDNSSAGSDIVITITPSATDNSSSSTSGSSESHTRGDATSSSTTIITSDPSQGGEHTTVVSMPWWIWAILGGVLFIIVLVVYWKSSKSSNASTSSNTNQYYGYMA